MADNVLGSLFQDQADAIREGLGQIGLIKPIDTPDLIRDIVALIGTGGGTGAGTGGGTETGLGDLKIATGAFNAGTGYRKTINHGLGKMPDMVLVYYADDENADKMATHASKNAIIFSLGLHSAMADVTPFKGYYQYLGFMGLSYQHYMDDAANSTGTQTIYCPNEETFQIGWPDDGSNGTGNGLLMTNTIYQWMAISGMGGVIGGGSADDRVKYVTFMYGATELYKQPVVAGDTCHDPYVNNLISAPTKESDVGYDYTFNGWSMTDGGSASSSALTNVTEDRTVYAAFKATPKMFTITWYDEDGTTVLKTEQVEYGKVPNYEPTKDGMSVDKWTPTPVAVTGNASYVVTWAEELDFATMAWSDIDAAVKAGKAHLFTLGATKTYTTSKDRPFIAQIVGINHDDLANGNGKAGLTIATVTTSTSYPDKGKWHSATTPSVDWLSCTAQTTSNFAKSYNDDNYTGSLPADLKAAIKTVTKTHRNANGEYVTNDVNWFLPAINEIVGANNLYVNWQEGTQYEYYVGGWTNKLLNKFPMWTRSKYQWTGSSGKVYTVTSSTMISNNDQTTSNSFYCVNFFCI